MAGYTREFLSIEQALKEIIRKLESEEIKSATGKSESANPRFTISSSSLRSCLFIRDHYDFIVMDNFTYQALPNKVIDNELFTFSISSHHCRLSYPF